jgi:uncharacterized SAM-binding protein YcdF (DUF218 family)
VLRKLARFILRAALGVAALYLLAALALALAGLPESSERFDAAVVFGNKVDPSGQPSASLASRLDKALLLYRRGQFSEVLVSGGVGREGWDEAQVMAGYLAARGIPREAILLDNQGNNTYLTALHTAQLARARGWRSFIVVTHFYHVPRARLAFQRFGLTPVGAARSDRFVARDFYYGLMREVIAYPAYLFRAYEE